jgi:hypothetical protein
MHRLERAAPDQQQHHLVDDLAERCFGDVAVPGRTSTTSGSDADRSSAG